MKNLTFKQKLKYTKIFDWISIICKTGYGQLINNDQKFFGKLFEKFKVEKIFDIGANDGVRARSFLRNGNLVVSVEPDPELVSILKYRFQNNQCFKVEQAAVSYECGQAIFERKKHCGFSTLSKKWSNIQNANDVQTIASFNVNTVSLGFLMQKYGIPDYIKVDVEGHELQVIRSLNQKVKIISFEVNLPEFLDESIEIIKYLNKLCPPIAYNYRIGIEQDLKMTSNISSSEIISLLTGMGKASFDVFGFMLG